MVHRIIEFFLSIPAPLAILVRFGERFSLGILVLVVILAGLYLLRRRLGKKRRRHRRGAIRRAVRSARQ